MTVAKAAQSEVQQAADTAELEAQKAQKAYEEALAKLADAQKKLEDAKENDRLLNISEDKQIQDEKDELNAITLTDSEKELADAELAFKNALQAATDAAAAAEIASDASAEASKLATDAAGEAEDQSEIAEKHADDAMNYYVDPAQEKLENVNKKVESQKATVSDLENQKLNAETAYNGIKTSVTQIAIDNYNKELAKKQKKMDDAHKEYESISKWNFIAKAIAKDKYEDAKESYENYNRPKVKNNEIDTALKSTNEYKTLTSTQNNLVNANKTLTSLETDAQKKAQVVADAQAVRDAYLASIKPEMDEQQKAAIVDALKATVGSTSDAINQTQYDAELAKWANEFWTAINIFHKEEYNDAKKVRTEYIANKYKVSDFSKIFENLGITQCTTDPDKLIRQVEQAYYAVLKQQEEELATVNAYIAKTDANGAATSADVAADLAAKAAAKVAAKAEAAKAAADLSEAQNKLNSAKETFAKAQASLLAAQEAASKMNATYVNFDKVMQIMEDAKTAVENAKAAKEKAEADAKAALEAKNKVDSIVANWKSTPDAVADDDGIDESAIVRAEVTAPAQLPTVQVTTINEAPVALTAEPTTTRRVRATTATEEDTTIIEEEETPVVAEPAIEEAVEEDVAVDSDTKEIVDEDTALASTMQENGFAWWWILIAIAIVTGGGFAGYRYYKNKKVIED